MDKASLVSQWQSGLGDLIGALADFRNGLAVVQDDAEFMRLYGALVAAGDDLDDFIAGDVGIDDLRFTLTGV